MNEIEILDNAVQIDVNNIPQGIVDMLADAIYTMMCRSDKAEEVKAI